MSGPGTTETRLTEADGELSSFDPLEETQQRVRVMLSRHPLWVVLVLLFVATAFAVSAALSGVIEDLVSAWFNEKAAPFLARNTIANGWVLLFLIAAFMLIATFLILAIHNYRLGRQLSTRVDEKSRRISELQNVLDNQKRLLDHFQRESALRGKRYERLIAGMREQIVSEREVLSILDMALVLMARSVLDRQESATQARQRFFGVYKRVIQKLFAHPADIRNVCVLEPRGDYLRFGSYCTVPLPEDAAFRLDPPAPPRDCATPVQGFAIGYFGKERRPTHALVVNLDYRTYSGRGQPRREEFLKPVRRAIVGPGSLEVFDAATLTWSAADSDRVELRLPPGGGVLVRAGRPTPSSD